VFSKNKILIAKNQKLLASTEDKNRNKISKNHADHLNHKAQNNNYF